jgi:hypothetical protein
METMMAKTDSNTLRVMPATEARAARIAEAAPRKWIKGPRCAQDYADVVIRCLETATEHVLNAGDALIKAKKKLDHGEWLRMFRGHPQAVARPIPFSARTGQMLMKIAVHPILSDANHGLYLPRSWRTLYELTKWPEPLLEQAIAEGHIHAGMERQKVLQLRVDLEPPTERYTPPAPYAPAEDPGVWVVRYPFDPDPLDLDGLSRDLHEAFRDLNRDEQVRVVERLRQIADDLEGCIAAQVPA